MQSSSSTQMFLLGPAPFFTNAKYTKETNNLKCIMYVNVTEQLLYTLWHQRHVSLIFFIEQLVIRQVTLQGLVLNHTSPVKGLYVSTNQTFHSLVWDHLHNLHKSTGEISASAHLINPIPLCTLANLFGDGREFHDVQRLVIGGCTLVNVDDHRGSSFAAEKSLKEFGELAFSERDVAATNS